MTAVEVAGPGFVNFRLADSWLHDVLVDVAVAGGRATPGPTWAATRVNVEFVTANPTGPSMPATAGGAATATLARLLERIGYAVTGSST